MVNIEKTIGCNQVAFDSMLILTKSLIAQIPPTTMRILNTIYQGKVSLDLLPNTTFRDMVTNQFAGNHSIYSTQILGYVMRLVILF